MLRGCVGPANVARAVWRHLSACEDRHSWRLGTLTAYETRPSTRWERELRKKACDARISRVREWRDNYADLRRPFERDDWQVSPAVMEADLECESIARQSGDECARFGARRRPRPACSWLDAWSPVGRPQTKVGFVGRLSLKCCVRPVPVVPSEEGIEVRTKACSEP